jgi:hypothetical protein
MSTVAKCDNSKSTKKVYIVKQWHLGPRTVTKGFKEKYPQERNQTTNYKTLSDMVKKKKLQVVVAEGCEGEINSSFTPVFNGWSIQDLAKQSQTRAFPKIITNVSMKLEARWGNRLLTVCGDNDKLIREGNLRLSNLRGWMGFWTKLSEGKADPDKLKLYSEAAADLLKIPKTTPLDQIQTKIKESFKEEMELFKKSLEERNTYFVNALKDRDFSSAAIIVGGLHAEDLKAKVQAAGYACEVEEPRGYQREDENLIKDFQKALN